MELATPQTHPNDPVIGKKFLAHNGHVYYCDSYDPSQGYWMTRVDEPRDRRNVSERAIGRTFHYRSNLNEELA